MKPAGAGARCADCFCQHGSQMSVRRKSGGTSRSNATPAAVADETTPSHAPDEIAPGMPERETFAAVAQTQSVTEPHAATPAAAEATPAEAHAEAPGASVDEGTIVGILTGVLDELGSAHHRPFSRG